MKIDKKYSPTRAAELFVKLHADTLTEAERTELDSIRAKDPELFAELSDPETIDRDYVVWNAIDTSRPRKEMSWRIRSDRFQSSISHILYALTGAAAVLILGIFIGRKTAPQKEEIGIVPAKENLATLIQPGQTRATLITAEDEIYEFSSSGAVKKAVEKVTGTRSNQDRENLNNLEIPRGGEFHITLEDGTEVWLNAATTLKYPETFNGDTRMVELCGEGFFKVAKDESRPFIVKSAGQLIRVLGTEFNVNAYEDEDDICTTLVEGSISLYREDAPSAELLLTPGHQAVFNKGNEATKVIEVNTDVVTSWRNEMFVFDDQTLDKIMRQLSRWYDFDYEFADASAASIVFKGRIPRYGKFGDALAILEKSGGLHFDVTGKAISIRKTK